MRAFITGATGFVGSYLLRLLVQKGHPVAALIRSSSDAWRIKDLLPFITVIEGSLQSLETLEPLLKDFAPDAILHLAWHGVGNQQHQDLLQLEQNLHSSLGLMRLAKDIGCKTWVGLGSQAEYGPLNCILNEDAPTHPSTLYGATKLSVYHLTKQLASLSSIRFAWLRLFSAYGPKDHFYWMIPSLIQKILDKKAFPLTLGEQLWDYLYVEDAADAIYQAAFHPAAEGVFNLGSGEVHTIRSVVEKIRDFIDPQFPLRFGEVPYRPNQLMHLQADITRLNTTTGWSPRISLEEGLKKTILWYKENHKASLID